MSSPLIPNVNKIGGGLSKPDASQSSQGPEKLSAKEKAELKNAPDFSEILKRVDLDSASPQLPIKFSQHAVTRMESRGIKFTPERMAAITDGVNKIEAKGGKEALVVTPEGSLIVSVPKRTVITVIDQEKMSENVFTNIDSAFMVKG
jgi:flagellar operon protein